MVNGDRHGGWYVVMVKVASDGDRSRAILRCDHPRSSRTWMALMSAILSLFAMTTSPPFGGIVADAYEGSGVAGFEVTGGGWFWVTDDTFKAELTYHCVPETEITPFG